MIHDTVGCGEHDVTEETRGEKVLHPLFHIGESNIETRGDDTALVDTANELHHNLARALVIDDFEFSDVAVLKHDLEKFDDNFGRRAHKNLATSTLLSIGNGLKTHTQNAHQHHCDLVG